MESNKKEKKHRFFGNAAQKISSGVLSGLSNTGTLPSRNFKSRSRSQSRNNVSNCSTVAVVDEPPVTYRVSSKSLSAKSGAKTLKSLNTLSNNVTDMNTETIDRRFEELLDDMNMGEVSKVPLRTKSVIEKATILAMQRARDPSNTRKDRAENFISLLRDPTLKPDKHVELLESLRIALKNNPISWVRHFDSPELGGLSLLLNHLMNSLTCARKAVLDYRVALACLRCLRAFANTGFGLSRLVDHETASTYVSRCCVCESPDLMHAAVEMLTAMTLTGVEGHRRVLEGLTVTAEIQHHPQGPLGRFQSILQGLMCQSSFVLRHACMQFINVIVSPPFTTSDELELDFRIHLRLEFYGLGLRKLLQALKAQSGSTKGQDSDESSLIFQISVFEDQAERDQDEFFDRYEALRLEMDDIHECFRLLSRSVSDSESERFLLSILQHLLMVGEDPVVRLNYFRVVEECVSQIIMQRANWDPDPRCQGLKLEVSTLLSKMADGGDDECQPKRLKDIQMRLDKAIQDKQEAEANVERLRTRLALSDADGNKVRQMRGGDGASGSSTPSRTESEGISAGGSLKSPYKKKSHAPLPPGVPIPPPPPIPGGPPAPPPPPGLGGKRQAPMPAQLPFGMKPKKMYKSDVPLKKANWKPVSLANLDRSSLWVGLSEEKLPDEDILKELQAQFSTRPAQPRKPSTSSVDSDVIPGRETNGNQKSSVVQKKPRELRILDARTGCNLGLVLGCIKVPLEDLCRSIVAMDDWVMNPAWLDQLVKYLPDPSIIPQFSELKEDYKNLSEPEQFCCLLSEVRHLHIRLSAMLYPLRFPELVNDVKPDIVAATETLREIQTSRKLGRLLEIVLLLGNMLNSGSRIGGQVVGYELTFLTKLSSTKDASNKRSLVHFLANLLETRFPDLVDALDEVAYLDRGSQVSEDNVTSGVASLNEWFKKLERDLQMVKKAPTTATSEHDQLLRDKMEFILEASRSQMEIVNKMLSKMQETFRQVAKYLAFDPKQYSMDCLFSDLSLFKDHLRRAQQDNLAQRQAEERMNRIHEDQAKRKREREIAAANRRRYTQRNSGGGGGNRKNGTSNENNPTHTAASSTSGDTNEEAEGLMDALLGALRHGSSFPSPGDGGYRRTRTSRPTGSTPNARCSGHRHRPRTRDIDVSAYPQLSGGDEIKNSHELVAKQLNYEEDDELTDAQLLLERLKQL